MLTTARPLPAVGNVPAYNRHMEVTVGTVVDGKVVLEGVPLPDGTRVTVLVEDESDVTLTEEQRAVLLQSAEQAERRQVVDGWELLREIKSKR